MATISGGDKLQQALAKISKSLTPAAGKPQVSVGFLGKATYPDGTSVAMVAAIQEFGAPRAGIPPRPYFRNMIAQNGKAWPDQVSTLLKAHDYDSHKVLGLMGELISGELRQSINDLTEPPLSPVTLMLRKMQSEDQNLVVTRRTVGIAAARVVAGESTAGVSAKPLIDSSHLINSIDYEVIDGS
jgi:hypothetical protein